MQRIDARRPGWLLVAVMAGATPAAVPCLGVVPQEPPPAAVDVAAFDAGGRPVTDLASADFSVTVDGGARKILAARHVARADGTDLGPVLIIVDQTSFPRGGERPVASAVDRLLERIAPTARVACEMLPTGHASVSFSLDRRPVRETLARLTGRARSADLGGSFPGLAGPVMADEGRRRASDEPRQADDARDPNTPPEDNRGYALDILSRLTGSLRRLPGPKAVVFVTAGLPSAAATGQPSSGSDRMRALVEAVEDEAIAAGAAVHVLGVPGAAARGVEWGELEEVAQDTGGSLVRPSRNSTDGSDRLALALSDAYVLDIETSPADRDGRLHAVKVGVRRSGIDLHSPRRRVLRDDPAVQPPTTPAAPPAAGATTAAPAAARERPEPAAPGAAARPQAGAPTREPVTAGRPYTPSGGRDPELDAVVGRCLQYLQEYRRRFANVVAEEDYVQAATRPTLGSMSGTASMRRLKADLLMVTAPDGTPWIPFRDVFEVDGKPVRDRDDRLRKLFLETPGEAMDQAMRIRQEASRYNLGSTVVRTVNVPTEALLLLSPEHIAGFRFRRGGRDTVERVQAWRIEFEEIGRPTFIRGASLQDVPASGTLWIEPDTGRILKTLLRARYPGFTTDEGGMVMEATVFYRPDKELGLWVPVEMRESYRSAGERIDATARYSHLRTFQVRTKEKIEGPRK